MKKLLTAAVSLVFALGVGTVLHADLYTPDVRSPDVRGVPEVGSGSTSGTSVPPAAQGGGTRGSPYTEWLPSFAGSSASTAVDSFPSLSFGAGAALTFSDTGDSDTFIATYMEGYPWVIGNLLGIGFTVSYDVVPVTDGEMVIGMQADVRWVFLPMDIGSMWLDCRVGPAYQVNAQSLNMYMYMDFGFDLYLGDMLLETRAGIYLTGTATGVVIAAGMEL
jgi:hypothetical protein